MKLRLQAGDSVTLAMHGVDLDTLRVSEREREIEREKDRKTEGQKDRARVREREVGG